MDYKDFSHRFTKNDDDPGSLDHVCGHRARALAVTADPAAVGSMLCYRGFAARRFEDVDEIIDAVIQATISWNEHRYPYVWKKAA